MSVRIYGDFSGTHSLAQVAYGFSSCFRGAFIYRLGDSGVNDLDETVYSGGGETATDSIFLGPLNLVHEPMFQGRHERRWVMVTPNSDRIGDLLKENIENAATHLLTPSRWAAGVLKNIFPKKPLRIAKHGIHEDYFYRARKKPDKMMFLHLSSSEKQRKGTAELLEGWKMAALRDAQLCLSVPAGAAMYLSEHIHDLGISKSVSLMSRLDYEPRNMAVLYSSVHFVVQPSRGEGFGLVPLEARACGTPVIATDCTGHREHMRGPGVVLVPTGELGDIDDLPGAKAPSLSATSVAAALTHAYKSQTELAQEAMQNRDSIRRLWAWDNQLESLKKEVGFEERTA